MGVLDTVKELGQGTWDVATNAPADIVNTVTEKLTPDKIPETVDDYRDRYSNSFPHINKIPDEAIANQVYSAGVRSKAIKNQTLEDFKVNFLPNAPENSVDAYRNKYQKQFPGLTTVTDAELANKIYDTRTNNGEKLNFINYLNKAAPRDYNNDYNQDLSDELGNIIGPNDQVKKQVRPDYTTDKVGFDQIAKFANVDTSENVPLAADISVKYAQGFAANPDNEVLAAKNQLNKFFNPDNDPNKTVQVRLGPKTGRTEFLNPVTNKWTMVDQPGFNYTDLAKQAGNSLTIGGTILGDIIGFTGGLTGGGVAAGPVGAAAGSVEGAILGGATGGSIGEMARIYLGKSLFGINKDVSVLGEGEKQFFINAGLGALGSYFKPTMQWLANYTKTGTINIEELKNITKNATQAKQLFEDVNNEFIKNNLPNRLQYSLGQATGNADMLATQAAFESNKAYGKTGKWNTWNEKNAQALDVYFGLQNKSTLSSNMSEDQLGAKISSIIADYKNSILAPLQAVQEKSIYDLTSATAQLPNGTLKESGHQIRNAVQTLQDSIKTEPGGFNDRFATLFKVGENRVVQTDLIKKTLNELDLRQKGTLFNQYPDIYKIVKAPEGQFISIQNLANTISDLKAYDRTSVKSIGGMTPIQGATKKLRDAMDAQLARDLPANDPWLQEYVNLKDEYWAYKNRFNEAIGSILKLKDGRLVVADEDVFNTTFKTGRGSQARIDSIHDVLKDNPDAINTYKNSILDFYNQNVVDKATGLVDNNKHIKFINNFQYGLKRFFGEENYGEISKIDGLNKAVQDANTKYATTLENLKKSTAGEIDTLKPDRIFSTVYNPAEPTRLKNVINILKDNPEVLQNFQDVVKKDLANNIKNNDGQFNFVKLDNYLKRNLQNLQTVFFDNPNYIKNIQNLNGVLQTYSKKSPLAGSEVSSFANKALNDYVRMRVGMFTKEGREVTMISRFVNYAKLNRMQNILTDPEYVENLIKMKDINLPKYVDYGTTLKTPSSTLTYGPFKFNSPLDQKKGMQQIQLYNQMGTQLFGMKLIDGDMQPPLSSYKKYENQPTSFPEIKKSITSPSQINKSLAKPVSQGPTSPNINIFKSGTPAATPVASAPAVPTIQGQPQAPASNITSIPQDQLNKYSTLFGPIV